MKKIFLQIIFTLSISLSYSQPTDPPADDDPPASAINSWIVITFIGALVLGYGFIGNKKKLKY